LIEQSTEIVHARAVKTHLYALPAVYRMKLALHVVHSLSWFSKASFLV